MNYYPFLVRNNQLFLEGEISQREMFFSLEAAARDGVCANGLNLGPTKIIGDDNCCAYLRKINLHRIVMREANLFRSDLQDTDLSEADFEGTDFRRSHLAGSDLQRGNFRDAIFRNANLQNVDAREGCFEDADFRNADLRGCDFRKANLQHAEFNRQTKVQGIKLAGANLTGESWEEYLHDFLPEFLQSEGVPLSITAEAWDCHQWDRCPIATAFNIHDPDDAPEDKIKRVDQFVILYDLGLIPKPKVAGRIAA